MNNIRLKMEKIILPTLIFLLIFFSGSAFGNSSTIHPMNKKLLKAGIMKKVPAYFPEIPRLTASQALALYRAQKALFVLASYENLHLISGGIHMTEGQANKMNPNRLPFRKGQVLIVYCP